MIRQLEPTTRAEARAMLRELRDIRILLSAKFLPEGGLAGLTLTDGETAVVIVMAAPFRTNINVVHELLAWVEQKHPDLWVESMEVVPRLPFHFAPSGDLDIALRQLGQLGWGGHLQHVVEARTREGLISALVAAALMAHVAVRNLPVMDAPYWRLDLHAAYALEHQRKLGYLTPDGLKHPTWAHVQPDGSPRISCRDPNLLGVPRKARDLWNAPDGCVWVELSNLSADWRMLAALSRDPWMGAVDHPRAAFDGGPRSFEITMLRDLLHHPGDYKALTEKQWPPDQIEFAFTVLREKAPQFWAWVQEERANPSGRCFMDRPLPEALRTDPRRYFAALTSYSLATMLKSQIAQLSANWALAHPLYSRIGNLIPLYDTLVYTVAASALFDMKWGGHLRHAVSTLERNINGVQFHIGAAVGPTWGSVAPVEPEAMGDIELASHFVPHQCPSCGMLFETAELLAQHEATKPAMRLP